MCVCVCVCVCVWYEMSVVSICGMMVLVLEVMLETKPQCWFHNLQHKI